MNNQSFFNYINNDLIKKAHLDTAMEETVLFLEASSMINTSNLFILSEIDTLKTDLTMLQSSLSELKKNESTLESSTLRIEKTKLYRGFDSLVKNALQLPEIRYQSFGTVKVSDPIEVNDGNQSNGATKIAFLFGVTSFLGLIGLSLVFKEWTNENPVLFKTLLAMASACIAVTLPGFLNINLSNVVKAGGSLGVFALVYFFVPVMPQKEFNLSVNLHGHEGVTDNILKKEGKLYLSVVGDSYTSEADINGEGKAIFYKLLPTIWKKDLRFRLDAKFFKIANPNATYKANVEQMDLKIIPKLISKIKGRVLNNGQGISNAKISLTENSDFSTFTDAGGNFKFDIPTDKQLTKFTLLVSKDGYRVSLNVSDFEEEIDANEAEEDIQISLYPISKFATVPTTNLTKSDKPPTVSQKPTKTIASQVEESSFIPVKLKLLYGNTKTTISFPANHTVQQLIAYLIQGVANKLAYKTARCELMYYGQELDRDKKVSDLDFVRNNSQLTEVQFKCNGNVEYRPAPAQNLEINGLHLSDNTMIQIGKSLYPTKVINNIVHITFYYGLNGEDIVIHDFDNKKKIVLKNVKYTEFVEGILVLTVKEDNTIQVIDRPK